MFGQIIIFVVLFFTAFGLSGCAGVVVAGAGAGAYTVASRENSMNQQQKDLQTKMAIQNEIVKQESIKAIYVTDIGVSVVNNDVLLLGVVKSGREKKIIDRIARSIETVNKVHNKIIVDYRYSTSQYLNDSLIANAIRTRMVFSGNTYLSKVDVEVFNNMVYVFGLVGSDKEKYFAEKIARTGKGVRSVHSFIHVRKNKDRN